MTTPSTGTLQADKIKEVFVAKMKRENIKAGTKAYMLAHHDYFYGVLTTIEALGYSAPTYWMLCLMTNRSIVEGFKPIKVKKVKVKKKLDDVGNV